MSKKTKSGIKFTGDNGAEVVELIGTGEVRTSPTGAKVFAINNFGGIAYAGDTIDKDENGNWAAVQVVEDEVVAPLPENDAPVVVDEKGKTDKAEVKAEKSK